jgi:hypothetical protein
MPTFSTRDEAINYVVASIEATDEVKDAYAEYDIDTIAEHVIGDYESGYAIGEDGDTDIDAFWAVVAANCRAR